jgi:uncharacterized protein
MHERAAIPASPAERIVAIDALRAIALFIVLAINAVTEFRVSIFTQFLPDATTSPSDKLFGWIVPALHTKGFILFSFLFGIGLAIQFERFASDDRRLSLLLRRLAVLLAFGLIHLFLIWNGDILTEYAIAGFIALPFLFGPRLLLPVAAALLLMIFLIGPFLPSIIPFPDGRWIWQHVEQAARVYGNGSFAEVLAFRVAEIGAIAPLHVIVFPRTLGLFLLGALIWRTGFFHRPAVTNTLAVAAGIAFVAGAALLILTASGKLSGWPGSWRWALMTRSLSDLLLAFAYGVAIIAVIHRQLGSQLMRCVAPLGRMAFTNYVLQSVILGWIFYGYGLGFFGRMGAANCFVVVVIIYAAQVAFSTWWLRHFRFGPLEWLWRSLMYGHRQPLRRLS